MEVALGKDHGSMSKDHMHTASLGRRDGLISAQVPPHQALDVPMMPYAFSSTNIYLKWLCRKSTCAVKCIGESARWADHTMHLVVKANSMSARTEATKSWATVPMLVFVKPCLVLSIVVINPYKSSHKYSSYLQNFSLNTVMDIFKTWLIFMCKMATWFFVITQSKCSEVANIHPIFNN